MKPWTPSPPTPPGAPGGGDSERHTEIAAYQPEGSSLFLPEATESLWEDDRHRSEQQHALGRIKKQAGRALEDRRREAFGLVPELERSPETGEVVAAGSDHAQRHRHTHAPQPGPAALPPNRPQEEGS